MLIETSRLKYCLVILEVDPNSLNLSDLIFSMIVLNLETKIKTFKTPMPAITIYNLYI